MLERVSWREFGISSQLVDEHPMASAFVAGEAGQGGAGTGMVASDVEPNYR